MRRGERGGHGGIKSINSYVAYCVQAFAADRGFMEDLCYGFFFL